MHTFGRALHCGAQNNHVHTHCMIIVNLIISAVMLHDDDDDGGHEDGDGDDHDICNTWIGMMTCRHRRSARRCV